MARGTAGQVILAWPGECGAAGAQCNALGNGAKATGTQAPAALEALGLADQFV
jgi:hypothetical protein